MNEKKYQEARRMLCLFLKTEAQKKGITYQKLAEITGFSQPNVSQILNAKYAPSLDNFLKLADAIGVNFFMESKNSPSDLNQEFENEMNEMGRRPKPPDDPTSN